MEAQKKKIIEGTIVGAGLFFGWLIFFRRRKNIDYLVPEESEEQRIPFALPPSLVEIENPYGVDCDETFKTCPVSSENPRLPCFSCKQFNYVCVHFPETVFTSDGVAVEANSSPEEGYCIPSPRSETPNRWISDPILTRLEGNSGWNFSIRCRYPHIFTQNDILSDCRIFRDPCYPHGSLSDEEGRVFDPKREEIWFDPFFQGRCSLNESERGQFIAIHDEIFGPRVQPARFRDISPYSGHPEGCSETRHLDTGRLSVQELLEAGVKETVARTLRGDFPPMCLPRPCSHCPLTGEYSEKNYFDLETRNCFCDINGGFVPVFVDEDMQGNYVDAQNHRSIPEISNACLKVSQDQRTRNIWMGGFVHPDRGPEELIEYETISLPGIPPGETYLVRYLRNYAKSAAEAMVALRIPTFERFACRFGPIFWSCSRNLEATTHFFWAGHCSTIFNEHPTQWWETNEGRFLINSQLRNIFCRDDRSPETSATFGNILLNPVAAQLGGWHQLQVEEIVRSGVPTDEVRLTRNMDYWTSTRDIFDPGRLYLL